MKGNECCGLGKVEIRFVGRDVNKMLSEAAHVMKPVRATSCLRINAMAR